MAEPANYKVKMLRPDLEGIPQAALPSGYSMRLYEPGDKKLWLKIQTRTERFNQITPRWFRQEFGADDSPLRERQFFLFGPGGDPLGTGTAWRDQELGGELLGRVHWLAVLPGFQGRGLGKVLLSAVCAQLRTLGHKSAYLATSTARLPALGLYLRYGFVPLTQTDQEKQIWSEVLSRLGVAEAGRT
jgi:GNAT superfamily N-acetyltransferase